MYLEKNKMGVKLFTACAILASSLTASAIPLIVENQGVPSKNIELKNGAPRTTNGMFFKELPAELTTIEGVVFQRNAGSPKAFTVTAKSDLDLYAFVHQRDPMPNMEGWEEITKVDFWSGHRTPSSTDIVYKKSLKKDEEITIPAHLGRSGSYTALPIALAVNDNSIIMDVRDKGVARTGAWHASSLLGPYGEKSIYSSKGTVTFTPKVTAGNYEVLIYKTAHKMSSNKQQFTINHNNEESVKFVDFTTSPSAWVSLGEYTFLGDGKETIVVSNSDDDNTIRCSSIKLTKK